MWRVKIGCLGIVVVAGFAFFAVNERLGTPGLDTVIDGMKCSGPGPVAYHVRAHLTILERGRQILVPPNIGRSGNRCWYWLHTHDFSGLIHIESTDRNFQPRLGQFFDLWKQPLSEKKVATVPTGHGRSIKAFVGRTPNGGDPRMIRLQNHTTLSIEIGPPFPIPRPFRFATP